MLLEYWEKRSLTRDNWHLELAGMGVDPGDSLKELARLIAGKGEALLSCYRFQAPMGAPGTIIVCHDLGRGLISLGAYTSWGKWHEGYEVLETLPVYVVLLSEDYHVPFANKFFRERFGKSHGKRCFEYLFGRTEPCEICETYSVLKTNAPNQ